MSRTDVVRFGTLLAMITILSMLSYEGHGTEQGGDKQEQKKKYRWTRVTPRQNELVRNDETVDALKMLEDTADELHTDARRLCEVLRNHVDPAVRIQAARTYAKI